MMHLPERTNAVVPTAKLLDYLLSQTHSSGGAKAGFFRALGFNETNYELLRDELLAIALVAEVVSEMETEHGTKYVLDGVGMAPSGQRFYIRTIWIIEPENPWPRFVTAYPASHRG